MKDTSVIPQGHYCYTWAELPSKENNFKGKINLCPYFKCKIINGVKVPWCNFLDLGGVSNNWTHEEWLKVKEYYKTEEEFDKNLPLFLLWDNCKECGENEE